MKAAISDITDFGFQPQQFGDPDNWDTADTGYVARVLKDVAREVRVAVGAARYDAAADDGSDAQQLDFTNIKRAEVYLAAAVLYRRLEAWNSGNTRVGRDGETEAPNARVLNNADRMTTLANEYIARVQVVSNTSGANPAFGMVETGPYPETAA